MIETKLGPDDAPCPFCKGTDLSVRPDVSEDLPNRTYAYHVFCHDCHARGRNHYRIGWCETPEAARQAWNDRDEENAAVVKPSVKRLHWHESKGEIEGQAVWSSGDPWVFWIVKNPADPKYVWCQNFNIDGFCPASPVRGAFDTLGEAMDAAQKDYDSRILAAIGQPSRSVDPALPLGERPPRRAEVSLRTMLLSDGRADHFVVIRVGEREVTPHAFGEEYKAAYHVALYDWLLNGHGEQPSLIDFNPGDWPARVLPVSRDGELPLPEAEALARKMLLQMFGHDEALVDGWRDKSDVKWLVALGFVAKEVRRPPAAEDVAALPQRPASDGPPDTSPQALRALHARVRRAITTASNDDLSKPRTEKRTRHVERLTTLLDVAAVLEALEEGGAA